MVNNNNPERKLSAIMFTDMVGYSSISNSNEKLALALLEEHRILLYHRSGGSALRVSKRRADLIMILLRHLYRDAVDSSKNNKPDVTLVAIGGFGRGRLNPCSDVDLLFLHPKGAKGLPKEASDLIKPFSQKSSERLDELKNSSNFDLASKNIEDTISELKNNNIKSARSSSQSSLNHLNNIQKELASIQQEELGLA